MHNTANKIWTDYKCKNHVYISSLSDLNDRDITNISDVYILDIHDEQGLTYDTYEAFKALYEDIKYKTSHNTEISEEEVSKCFDYIINQSEIHFIRMSTPYGIMPITKYIYYIENIDLYFTFSLPTRTNGFRKWISPLFNNSWFVMETPQVNSEDFQEDITFAKRAKNSIINSLDIRFYYSISQSNISTFKIKLINKEDIPSFISKDQFDNDSEYYVEMTLQSNKVLYLPTIKLNKLAKNLSFDLAITFYQSVEKQGLAKYLDEEG